MPKSQIEQVLRMARAYAAEKLPWFSPALYSAPLVLTDACPSIAAIDSGMRVYFNPKHVTNLLESKEGVQEALPELAFVWVHEISHRLREHKERALEKGAHPELWQFSTDLEINDARWEGLKPPKLFPPLLPKGFRLPSGRLAEFYHDELLKQGWMPDALAIDEGSGVHGQKREWELPEDDPEAPAIPTIEQELIQKSVAEATASQKRQGDIPQGWVRWAEEVLEPKVDWRKVLRKRVRGAVVIGTGKRIDYTFSRSHRRGEVYVPVLPPSLQGDFSPRIACVLDTSGSISERELSQALAEVREVLESLHVPVTVIPCDAVPYEPIKVLTKGQLLRLRLKGGGGTDMVKGIEAALRLKPKPDVILVLTDGYTPFPKKRYKVPVIFGIFALDGKDRVPLPPIPPWSKDEVIIIPLQS